MRRSFWVAALALATACSNAKYIRPTSPEPFKSTPERVARGEYLVNQVTNCGVCHTQRDSGNIKDTEGTTAYLGGGNTFAVDSPKVSIGIPNITSDDETGLGKWTDDEIARAIRDGVDKNGKFLFLFMPADNFQHLSDEDVQSIVVYLRTVPKVHQTRPRQPLEAGFFLRTVLKMVSPHHLPAKDVQAPPKTDKVAYGHYLAKMGDCTGCHNFAGMGPRAEDDKEFMSGSTEPFEEAKPSKVYARNLTPDPEFGLGKYSADDIKQALHTGHRLDGKRMAPPMSLVIPHVSGMSDEDLDCLVTWLKSLKPVHRKVPERELVEPLKSQLEQP